jgi:cytochrome c-type biogenesis protein
MTAPSIALALLAGLASFLSPCVLPMVPAYIGYLGGRAVAAPGESGPGRLTTFLHALAFVLGFSMVFVALGAAAGGLGRLLRADWVRWLGGLVMVFFGLALMGAVKLPVLYTERRLHLRAGPNWGHLSSLLVGVSFAAGWTPCVGPVLGAILALGASQKTAGQAALLLTAYSLGLGVPFLLVGLAVDRMGAWLRRLHRYLHPIQVATGAVILIFGVLLFMDWLRVLGAWLTSIGLGWDLGL